MLRKFFGYFKRFRRELSLVKRLNNELKKLKKSIDNRKQLVLESRHILRIISRLEKAEIYWFIREDIEKIKKNIRKLRKNPKNRGLIYFLTSVYIVAPFTFEATGVIMFFRYMWRLVRKIKKL